MKKLIASGMLACALMASSISAAPPSRTYQVTGPIVELTDTAIVVQKGNEKWEVARTPDTKVTGVLKVGAKVTVSYTMTAKSVEVKGK